ncbi:MAG: nucleotidyl transferase AbiEii/AbiGii toxin family protein [Armatimonadetes bacterium]|nr:nucleotidyl transferase AbiEii/AbiGii toxin family protein [Armatimonadota bacterium]CUU36274.1 Nucleotidyl transferase AbiEii toxin, Type IV TA system [Armatimonadetes bacterium DC]
MPKKSSRIDRSFQRVFRDLLNLLSDPALQPLDAVLIGGIAVSLVAKPRFTADIDMLLTNFDLSRLGILIERAPEYGFEFRVENPLQFAQHYLVILMQHRDTRIPVDISLGFSPFENEVASRATPTSLGSLRLRVATPEDLVIMKLVAQRPIDLIDVQQILAIHPHMDKERILYWVSEFSAALEMPELLENARRVLNQASHGES